MLTHFFHSQTTHTKQTNERLSRLNHISNLHVKPPAQFNTKYGQFNNHFFKHLETLKLPNRNEEDLVLNTDIQAIHNVYQPSFTNLHKVTGFGDFIRGCLYVLEFAEKHNVSCHFHIHNHNLNKYLTYFANMPPLRDSISKNIYKYAGLNAEFTAHQRKIEYTILPSGDNSFLLYLNSLPNYMGNVYINTTNFPSRFISPDNIDKMKHMLEPIPSLKSTVLHCMNKHQLVPKTYITYHIRLGDHFLENPTDTVIHQAIVQEVLQKMVLRPNETYLLITDTPALKKIVMSYFKGNNIQCLLLDIGHTSKNEDAIGIKNTLIEFYVMSFSKAIISMSVYPHGSGFSKWCSVVYNIPYVCYLLTS